MNSSPRDKEGESEGIPDLEVHELSFPENLEVLCNFSETK
jgi:hypothetical protein